MLDYGRRLCAMEEVWFDCGQWLKDPKQRTVDGAWLLGFMSGISIMYGNKTSDPLAKVNSAQQIYAWMDNYCQKNPLSDVGTGGLDLFIELTKK
jgi:hypothetical protein